MSKLARFAIPSNLLPHTDPLKLDQQIQIKNKHIYFRFNNAINIAKNLQPGNENSSWSKWSLTNIGGRRLTNKAFKNKKTKSSKLKIKKSKKSKH